MQSGNDDIERTVPSLFRLLGRIIFDLPFWSIPSLLPFLLHSNGFNSRDRHSRAPLMPLNGGLNADSIILLTLWIFRMLWEFIQSYTPKRVHFTTMWEADFLYFNSQTRYPAVNLPHFRSNVNENHWDWACPLEIPGIPCHLYDNSTPFYNDC